MFQLKILSGKRAGDLFVARRFPVQIGRAPDAGLRLEEDGVWDRHLLLDFKPAEGFILSALAGALASVNGQPIHQTLLRNGDLIQIGSLRMQFWLGESVQSGLGLREALTWFAIGAVSLGQVGLIYWLLR